MSTSVSAPVDSSIGLTATGNVTPVHKFDPTPGAPRVQDTSDGGVPMWDLEALYATTAYGQPVTEVIRVRLPSPAEPRVAPGPVQFVGLSVTASAGKRGFAASGLSI